MLQNTLIKCHATSKPSYLRIAKSLSLIFTRNRHKYSGKKTQDYSKVVWEHKNVPDTETTDFEVGEFSPRRLTWMPEGLPQHRGKKIKWWDKDRTPITVNINPVEMEREWVEEPNYPPIKEMSTGFMRGLSEEREARIAYYKSLDRMPTFDQKMQDIVESNVMPTIRFSSIAKHYDYLPLYNYMTRTHLIDNELPASYQTQDAQLDALVDKVKPHILNAIRNFLEFETAQPFYEVPANPLRHSVQLPRLKRNEALIQNLHNVCMKELINDEEYDHLNDSIVEYNADVRAWWWGSQFRPSMNIRSFQVYKVEKVNQSVQYVDYAPLNIRMNEPLVPPISDQNHELIRQQVARFPTNPYKLGFKQEFKRIMSVPGFLPSLEDQTIEQVKSAKQCDFPFLTFLNREYLNIRNEAIIDDFKDDDDVIKAMAVIHNFAYLTALANTHGFTTYNELTYPFTNQTIITDGQNWSFFVYQMNTHTFHTDLPNSGKANLCWSINNVKLYESYENGQFVGLNDEVIKNFVRMYLQKPSLSSIYSDLRPHLGVDQRSMDERLQLREDLLRRYGQVLSGKEINFRNARRVQKFEWIYMRNPVSMKKFIRKPQRPKYHWPKEKIQAIAHKFSDQMHDTKSSK